LAGGPEFFQIRTPPVAETRAECHGNVGVMRRRTISGVFVIRYVETASDR